MGNSVREMRRNPLRAKGGFMRKRHYWPLVFTAIVLCSCTISEPIAKFRGDRRDKVIYAIAGDFIANDSLLASPSGEMSEAVQGFEDQMLSEGLNVTKFLIKGNDTKVSPVLIGYKDGIGAPIIVDVLSGETMSSSAFTHSLIPKQKLQLIEPVPSIKGGKENG